jgi:crotonobetainyl-CoA:carnitine CoA-transferase CaiB-like acyl-CoA transferase
MEKLGLGYEDVARTNPDGLLLLLRLRTWRTVSGQAGADLLAQAMGGLAWATGRTGGYPRTAGSYVVDAYAAMLAAVGILAALQARLRTGRGQRVDVCLLDAALHMQCQELTYHLNGGTFRSRENDEVGHPLEPGPYGIYPTADGQFLAVSSGPWPNLCRALGTPALESDPRFDTPRNGWSAGRKCRPSSRRSSGVRPRGLDHAPRRGGRLERSGLQLCRGRAGRPGAVGRHGHDAAARRDRRVQSVGNPVHLSETPPSYRTPPPPLGADTDAVLATSVRGARDRRAAGWGVI